MTEYKRLIVLNNPCLIPKTKCKYDRILYAPLYKSLKQKESFQRIFTELKVYYPKIEWCEDIESLPSDHVLSWDASYERRCFGDQILGYKNRLFDTINFEIENSFTSFRKQAEKRLPPFYEDAISPVIKDVQIEIDYYFNQSTLPLTYFDDRNGMVGRNYSTKFSRFLSQGTLDVRYLYNCIKEFECRYKSNKSTNWIVFELLWREFFYWHYHKYTEHYFSENGILGDKDFSAFRKYNFSELKEVTDDLFFMAALNELEQTGFMSNRARQMFASFWINDLGLNWRSGAYFFEENLLDYDVFSNYGNWMYLAGVGVDPRGKRYFNISKQLKTYDPDGIYIKKWI